MSNFLFVSASSRKNLGVDPSVVYRCINPSRFASSMKGSHSTVCSLISILTQFKDFKTGKNIHPILGYAFTCKKIIFHRPIFSFTLALLIDDLKKRGIVCAADYDDLIFSLEDYKVTSAFERMTSALSRANLIKSIAKNFDALQLFREFSVSTPNLAQALRRCVVDKSVDIERVPNTPPLSWIEMAKSLFNQKNSQTSHLFSHKETKILGYFGGTASHNSDFNVARDDIISFLEKDHKNRFMFCKIAFESTLGEYFPRQIISFPPVCFNELPTLYHIPDVCIAPLKTSSFNHSKSSLKFFECALFGKPLVSSYNPSITERYGNSKMLFQVSPDISFLDKFEEAFQFIRSPDYFLEWESSLRLIEMETNMASKQTQSFLMK